MKPKVAFLRGANLNDAELASYTPLTEAFQFSFYHCARGALPIRAEGVQTKMLWYGDDLIRALPRKLRNRAMLAAMQLTGPIDIPLDAEAVCASHAIVHTAETFSGYSLRAVDLKRRHRHKVVVTVWENIPFLHENTPTRPFGNKLAPAKARVRQGADHFLVPSESARQALELEGVPPERISYTGVAVDLKRFQPRARQRQLHRRLGIDPQARIVLFAGRMIWEKGVFDLLEAFARLHRAGRLDGQTHLLYCGNPFEKERLAFESERLQLTHRVHFLSGQVYANIDQMPSLYNDADVLVLPSLPTRFWKEQFGIVLIEAMASGLPVIGASNGAIPEVVGDGGLIFPAHDTDALARVLEGLLNSPTRCRELAERGRARVEAVYSPQAVSQRIQRAYELVLSGGPGP